MTQKLNILHKDTINAENVKKIVGQNKDNKYEYTDNDYLLYEDHNLKLGNAKCNIYIDCENAQKLVDTLSEII